MVDLIAAVEPAYRAANWAAWLFATSNRPEPLFPKSGLRRGLAYALLAARLRARLSRLGGSTMIILGIATATFRRAV